MFLEHLIKLLQKPLLICSSSHVSFSRHIFLPGMWVEGRGDLPAAAGTAHLRGALQSCLDLPVPSLLQPLGHLPAVPEEKVARVTRRGRTPGRELKVWFGH